jgi:cellulose synthase/poly-beta-1,6-N-acetylglucosamine synthase-like glycosyltransferase
MNTLWLVAGIVMLVLAVPFVLAALYLLVLTVAACLHPDRQRISGIFHGPRVPQSRFVILIPAHNEELLLGDVLHRLRDQSYPKTHYEVVVIADNCEDMTAEVARKGGATTLVRHDLTNRGKGQALNWAMQGPLMQLPQPWDAVVIMDADSVLNADFLWFMDERLRQGHQAMQGYYGVQNPGDSWRTALMTVALAAFHFLRPLGRDKLGLPCGLKGNGMCFARQLVERFGYPASSVVEDIELALMYLRHGIGVKFAAGAQVFGQMAATTQQADSQRKRWEGGRLPLLKNWALPLWREGLRERNLAKLDGALDLFVPPLTLLLVLTAAGFFAALVVAWLAASQLGWIVCGVWSGALLALVVYVCAGLALIEAPAGVWLRLAAAPVFVFWKLGVYLRMACARKTAPSEWVRTDRKEMK